jgi:hypothetical protein
VTNESTVGRIVLEEEYGTIELPDGRAIVFMPLWYYGLALAALFAFGFAIGYFVFAW